MGYQVYDDGSALWTDDAGNVTQVQDSQGVVSQPDRTVTQSIINSLLGAFNTKLNQAVAPKPIVVQQTPVQQVMSSPLVPLVLLGLGVFAVIKLAS